MTTSPDNVTTSEGVPTGAPTLETVAAGALEWFEYAYRVAGDDSTGYVKTRDGRPEWVRELVYAAHDDMVPDDWRYACIRDALEHVAEYGEDCDDYDSASEFADSAIDVYNGERLEWLGSNYLRAGYVDEACEELGAGAELGVLERIGYGQYHEASLVLGSVVRSLEDRLESVTS